MLLAGIPAPVRLAGRLRRRWEPESGLPIGRLSSIRAKPSPSLSWSPSRTSWMVSSGEAA